LTILRVAVISGADNGSLFMPFGVLTFSRPFAILSFYRKQSAVVEKLKSRSDTIGSTLLSSTLLKDLIFISA